MKKRIIFTISIALITGSTILNANEECDLELHSILEVNDSFSFSLKSKSTGQARWTSIGKTVWGHKLLTFEPEQKELTISSNKDTYKIRLIVADDSAVPLQFTSSEHERDKTQKEFVISLEDIDPETPGKQSYVQARSKLKYEVSARNGNSFSSTHESQKLPNPRNDSDANANTITEAEVIAMQSFEKNYVAKREAPRDVDIRYEVSPRQAKTKDIKAQK